MSKRRKKPEPSRRKLRRTRKTDEHAPTRDKRWNERYRGGDLEHPAASFERIVSRHDRRRSDIQLARQVLREQQMGGAGGAPEGAVEGVIVDVISGGCIVEAEGKRRRAVLRGLLKSLETQERNVIAVGDRVLFTRLDDGTGVVERVLPRTTVLSRRYMEREHVVAANIDQLVIVASVDEPPVRSGLIDRYLVAAENGGLQPVILLNKIDLPGADEARSKLRQYPGLGYPVQECSAESGEGLDAVRDLLRNRSSIFAGQSGVGKSTILNALQPGLELRVGEVSESTGKGIHTTTSVSLLSLDFGGWVVDTPGIREFALWDFPAEDLPFFFPEFEQYLGRCKYRGCTHTHEPGCAVREAYESGEIDSERYESYCRLFESLK